MFGIATAFSFTILLHKLRKKRIEDFLVDVVLLIILATLFSGSQGGLTIAMIASAIISGYLWFYPPNIFKRK